MNPKIIVFGNPALPYDNLALKVGEMLRKEGFSVQHLDDPLELLKIDFARCVILDVAYGIDAARLLTDVDRLVLGRLSSLHDFDMAYFLKMMKQLGKLGAVRIIAIPQGLGAQEAAVQVRVLLAKIGQA